MLIGFDLIFARFFIGWAKPDFDEFCSDAVFAFEKRIGERDAHELHAIFNKVFFGDAPPIAMPSRGQVSRERVRPYATASTIGFVKSHSHRRIGFRAQFDFDEQILIGVFFGIKWEMQCSAGISEPSDVTVTGPLEIVGFCRFLRDKLGFDPGRSVFAFEIFVRLWAADIEIEMTGFVNVEQTAVGTPGLIRGSEHGLWGMALHDRSVFVRDRAVLRVAAVKDEGSKCNEQS